MAEGNPNVAHPAELAARRKMEKRKDHEKRLERAIRAYIWSYYGEHANLIAYTDRGIGYAKVTVADATVARAMSYASRRHALLMLLNRLQQAALVDAEIGT